MLRWFLPIFSLLVGESFEVSSEESDPPMSILVGGKIEDDG